MKHLEVHWQGRRLTVPPNAPYVIGRDPDADLRIDHPKVSRRHLVIYRVSTGWELSDESSNGSFVDGQRIEKATITGPLTVTLGNAPQAPSLQIMPPGAVPNPAWVPVPPAPPTAAYTYAPLAAPAPPPVPAPATPPPPAQPPVPAPSVRTQPPPHDQPTDGPTPEAPVDGPHLRRTAPPTVAGPALQVPGTAAADPAPRWPAVPPVARPAAPPHPPAQQPAARMPAPPPAAGPALPHPVARSAAAQGRVSAVHNLRTNRLRIGRAPDNDVVIDDLLASRYHAELYRDGAGWRLVDIGSANGTYLNGHRVKSCPLGASDLVGIGHAVFYLEGDRLVEHRDSGEISFRAQGLVVRAPGGKQLLDRVGFSLEERSLLAVVGPSGAGKSTLLRALTGFRPAEEGYVQYASRDLYADYDELRQRIGLVPQDDILHKELTVQRALGYAARLRFPSDVARSERKQRIDEVIGELGLTEQRKQRISSLSGGQRKRTSVALELLTRPSLLFLDEPTSGLDPGLDKSVMQSLRRLADDGRTVVVVTHSVAHLDVCDRLLLLAPGGAMAFFGPPQEALRYFNQPDFADLFMLLERERSVDWGARFRNSPEYARYIGQHDGRAMPSGAPKAPPGRGQASGWAQAPGGGWPGQQPVDRAAKPPPPPRQQSALSQFAILCRRYLAVIGADRQYVLFMAGLPLVLTGLLHALPGDSGLSFIAQFAGQQGSPNSLLLVMVVGCALMGSNASIRELVKEREIYRRERAIGLSRGAYLCSKLVVLAAITGLQAVALVLLGNYGRPDPDSAVLLSSPRLEILIALIGLTLASMALGLTVSAAIKNEDRGMPLLVLLAMLQFMLSSALIQIVNSPVLAQLSWLVPARWGFAMGASTIGTVSGPGTRSPYPDRDLLWQHNSTTWLLDLAGLAGLTVLFILLTAVLLGRLDPRRRG